MAHGGHEARARRDLLLPALEAAAGAGRLGQPRRPQPRLEAARRPAGRGVRRRLVLRPARRRRRGRRSSPTCATTSRAGSRARSGSARALEAAARAGRARRRRTSDATWLRSPCLGQCERAPAVLVTSAGPARRRGARPWRPLRRPTTCDRCSTTVRVVTGHAHRRAPMRASLAPQAGDQPLRLLARVGRVDPTVAGRVPRGSAATRRCAAALKMGAAAVIEEVTASKLVGRGGAAFPTGRKWAAVAAQPATPRYLVCNADESEPGTFKDRVILEQDPFALVESMTIAAFAVGASRGYLYLRGEYPLARRRLADAIDQARAAGLLGANVRGLGLVVRHRAAASAPAPTSRARRRRCSSRSRAARPEPRNKPPFPVELGLFGKPTAVNNVETLVNVPLILRNGGRAYATIGTEGSTGPKLFCVSGHVERPGRLRGRRSGRRWASSSSSPAACRAGGGSRRSCWAAPRASFVGPDKLDTPLTFEGTRAAGATLGSGVVMVFDETADLAGALRRIAAFFRDESCGQCVPCRVGTVRQEELLARLAGGAAARIARRGARAVRATSPRRCATRRSAASARRRPPRSRARIRGGLVHFDGIGGRRMTTGDIDRIYTEPAGPAVAHPAGAARRREVPTVELTHRRRRRLRPGRLDDPRGRPLGRASTRRRCATSRTSRRSTCAGCASSRSPDRACSSRPARGASRPGWRSRPTASASATRRRLVLELLGSSVDLSLAGPAEPDGDLARYADRYDADADALRTAGRAGGRRRARRARARATTTRRRRRRHARAAETVAQPVKVDNDLYVRDYSRCILCYKCVEACGERRPEHVRDRGRRARLRRPDLDRVRRPAARVGLRLLRQLHRRLPDGRADVPLRVRDARGRHVGRPRRRPSPTRSAPTAASAARSRSTSRTTGS